MPPLSSHSTPYASHSGTIDMNKPWLSTLGKPSASNSNQASSSSLKERLAAFEPAAHPNWLAVEVEMQSLSSRRDAELPILWATMKNAERACCTTELIREVQQLLKFLKKRLSSFHATYRHINYLVWRSESSNVFSLGGDLAFFSQCVINHDYERLRKYAHDCIDVLHDIYQNNDINIMNVALVQGDAIGGGLEFVLANDIVIAESDAKFSFPEVSFNLFPGMGGYSFLVRKIGTKAARQFLESRTSKCADEMKELGLIDIVAKPGCGEQALRSYIAENRFERLLSINRAWKRVSLLEKCELLDIADNWVELAMKLTDCDLRRMACLARVQVRKRSRQNG